MRVEHTNTYHTLLKDILANGHQKGDRTGTGTISVYGRQIRFNMKDGFPLLTTKKLHLRSIIHELLWFLQGDTNIKYLNDNKVTIWDEWADEHGNLGPVYGKQWVDWGSTWKSKTIADSHGAREIPYKVDGFNQIQNAIDLLENDPDSRRIIVSAWNVGELDQMALVPCHNFFQFYTRELTFAERRDLAREYSMKHGKLPLAIDAHGRYGTPEYMKVIDDTGWDIPKREISLMWNQRSVDTFLGLPFNIASYAMLLEMFAQQVNMVPGELIGNLGDTHIYSNHVDYVQQQLERDPYKYSAPRLELNKAKDIFSYKFEDFKLEGYESYPNWKGVPIAV